jgi:putative membrane protein
VTLALVFACALLAGLYALGALRLWRRGGVGAGVSRVQALSFFLGLGVVLLAVASPLDALAHLLFSAHMAQHVLLMLVAAPLLVYGAPLLPGLWALPKAARTPLGRVGQGAAVRLLTRPFTVWVVGTLSLWFWHLPEVYQAALRSPLLHALEHASFLGTAALFWWVVLRPLGYRGAGGYGSALLLVFATKVQSGALAAIISFAPTPIYPIYEATASPYGRTALEDQLFAGLIMSTPAGVIYLLTGAALFLLWLGHLERRARGRRVAVAARR